MRTAPRIAAPFHQNCTTVLDVLKRFLAQGPSGLAYRKPLRGNAKVAL
ncbi:hypothetical protein [Thermus caldilimi]